jgi:hypothetical protein
MIVRRIKTNYILSLPEEFPREDNQTQDTQINSDHIELREFLLNVLKNLQLKKRIITIVVGNLNNYTAYSILSSKSAGIEIDFGFIEIEGYKELFK